jgi:hypothetical protein
LADLGLDVTTVPAITLRLYAHRFNHAAHAQRAGERTEAEFGAMLLRTVLKEAVR